MSEDVYEEEDSTFMKGESFLKELLAPAGIQYYEDRADKSLDMPEFSLEKIRKIWAQTYGTGFLWKLRFKFWMLFPQPYYKIEEDWSGCSALGFRFKKNKEHKYKLVLGFTSQIGEYPYRL